MEREPSSTPALRSAARSTRRVLIDGFRPTKWAVLSLLAWLATVGSGNAQLRIPMIGRSTEWHPDTHQQALAEVSPWMVAAILAIVLIAVFAVALRIVAMFVESRGAFALVDALVRDRAALARPWRRFSRVADAVFVFRLQVAAAELAIVAGPLLVGAIGLCGWAWLSPEQGAALLPLGLLAAAICGMFVLSVFAARTALRVVVDDLVVPVMYVRRCSVLEALGFVGRSARRWPRAAVRYVVTRAGVGVGSFVAGTALCAMFCCIQWIPLVDAVILLPVTVYVRTFSMHFVAQLADDLAILGPGQVAPV